MNPDSALLELLARLNGEKLLLQQQVADLQRQLKEAREPKAGTANDA
jgi:hypothetical protein